MTKWSKGAPPCEGWWNASFERNAGMRRWWNGKRWSAPVELGDPEVNAERAKRTPADPATAHGIEWRGLTKPRKP